MFRKLIFLGVLLVACNSARGGQITITSPAAADVKFNDISQYGSSAYYNYGGYVNVFSGTEATGREHRGLLHFLTLATLMKQVETDSGYAVTWDSGIVSLSIRKTFTSIAENETLYVGFYKLEHSWGEGTANGAIGLGACWVNSDSTSGVAATVWLAAGCSDTTVAGGRDHSGTVETITSRTGDTKITIADTVGTGQVTKTFPISGATVTDTLNNYGLLLATTRLVGNATTYVDFWSDDGSAALRPSGTFYFHRTTSAPVTCTAKKIVGVRVK